MAADKRTLTLHVATGEPRLGLWCDRCLLPSVIEVDAHFMCAEHGSHKVGTYRQCTSCGTNGRA